jgi:outer membrane protein assembly factor BamB
MNAVALAVVLSMAANDAPVVVWTQELEGVRRMKVIGNDLLLTVEDRYEVRDASTGTVLGSTDNGYQSRLSAGRLLIAKGAYTEPESIEAWSLRPFQRLWSVPVTERVSLGEIVGETLIYATKNSLIKIDLNSRYELDRRQWSNEYNIDSVRSFGKTVYFRRGHEVFGLSVNDFSQGWRNYCDSWPQFVDKEGFVGTGAVYHPLAIVRADGKTVNYERKVDGHYTFFRVAPAVTEDAVIVPGNISVFSGSSTHHEVTVLSSYMFAFDRGSGKELWRIPMGATSPVILNGKLFHIGGNKLNGELISRYQLRDVRTGKLLWKSAKLDEDYDPQIVSNGQLFFELANGKLRALRLK